MIAPSEWVTLDITEAEPGAELDRSKVTKHHVTISVGGHRF